MRARSYQFLRRLFLVFILGAGVFVLYWGVTGLLKPGLENYVRRSLPEGLESREVSFQLMPFKINLEKSSLESGPGRRTQVEEITVNPQLGSLFGDTFVIDTLEFDGVDLTFYRENTPETAPVGGIETLPDLPTSGTDPSTKFRINRVQLTNARVRLMDNPESREPLLNLSPIRTEFGPVTPNSLKKGLGVTVLSGLWGEGDHLQLQATLRYGETLDVTGDLRLREIPLDQIHPELIPGLRLTQGVLDGDASFEASTNRLRIRAVNLRVKDSRITYRQPPPIPSEPHRSNTQSDTPSDEESLKTMVEDVQLELVETRLYLPALTGRAFHVGEGLLKAGPYQPENESMPTVGQLLFKEPTGLFEFKSDLDLSGETWKLANFLSDFRVDNVNELESYLGDLLPVRFRSGQLQGGIRGSLSAEALDLAVELDFDKLRLRSGKTDSSNFLGVPVSVYLNYLSKNDGELNLSFRVRGSPSNPSIEISKLRSRLITNLGIDAAVIGTLGLPVYVGDKVLEKVTGFSVIDEARSTISNFFEDPKKKRTPVLKTDSLETPPPENK